MVIGRCQHTAMSGGHFGFSLYAMKANCKTSYLEGSGSGLMAAPLGKGIIAVNGNKGGSDRNWGSDPWPQCLLGYFHVTAVDDFSKAGCVHVAGRGKKNLFLLNPELQTASLRNHLCALPSATNLQLLLLQLAKWLSRMQCESLSEGNAEPETFLNKMSESAAPTQCLPLVLSTEKCSSFVFAFHKRSYMILQDLLWDASLTCSQAFPKPSSHLAAPRNLLKNYEMCMQVLKLYRALESSALPRVGRVMWGCLYLVTAVSALTTFPLRENHKTIDWFELEAKKSSIPKPLAVGSDTHHQPRLLRAPSSLLSDLTLGNTKRPQRI